MIKNYFLPLFGILIISLLFTSGSSGAVITSVGSNTVFPIIDKAAHEFAEATGHTINPSGPGSGAGIAALLNNQTDIAPMSRAPKDSELTNATNLGFQLNITVIALDALVVVVNPSNPIISLSATIIGKIFSGEIRKWSELGWESALDDNIKIVERDENSGTHDFFNDFFLEGKEVPADQLGDYHSQFTSTSNLFQVIADEPNAIGYGGVGYLNEHIKAVQVNGVDATTENAGTGAYPVTRPLFVVFDNNITPQPAKDFVAFLLSTRGQEIAEEVGYLGAGARTGYYSPSNLANLLAEINQAISDASTYNDHTVLFGDVVNSNNGLPFPSITIITGITAIAVISANHRQDQ